MTPPSTPSTHSSGNQDVAVLAAWHDAVNAGDVEAAVGWCSDDVAVQGPRGVGHGHDLVRSWLQRSGIRLEPQEEFVLSDGRFVVREVARWTTADAPRRGAARAPGDLVRLPRGGRQGDAYRAVRDPGRHSSRLNGV